MQKGMRKGVRHRQYSSLCDFGDRFAMLWLRYAELESARLLFETDFNFAPGRKLNQVNQTNWPVVVASFMLYPHDIFIRHLEA